MDSIFKKQINLLLYKAERLVSALYMVTDLINSDDPLKWRMRQAGVVLLTEVGKLSELSPADRKKNINSAREATTEILSLLEVAVNAGLISRMNHALLKKEFTGAPLLLERVEKTDSMKSKGLNKDYPIGHSIGQPKFIKDRGILPAIGQSSIGQKKVNKEVRKGQFIKIFQVDRPLSVGEVSELLPDFGSKMIQRTLIDLVKIGILKKQGNKRWSRYSLASNS